MVHIKNQIYVLNQHLAIVFGRQMDLANVLVSTALKKLNRIVNIN